MMMEAIEGVEILRIIVIIGSIILFMNVIHALLLMCIFITNEKFIGIV